MLFVFLPFYIIFDYWQDFIKISKYSCFMCVCFFKLKDWVYEEQVKSSLSMSAS